MSSTLSIFGLILPDREDLDDPISWEAATKLISSKAGSGTVFVDCVSSGIESCATEVAVALRAVGNLEQSDRRSRLCLLAAASAKLLNVYVQDIDGSFRRVSDAAWRCNAESPMNPLLTAMTGLLATIANLIPKSCDAGRLSGASLFVSRAELEAMLRVGFASEAFVRREIRRLVVECAEHKYVPKFDDFLKQLRVNFPKLSKRRLLEYWKHPNIPKRWSRAGRKSMEGRPLNWTHS